MVVLQLLCFLHFGFLQDNSEVSLNGINASNVYIICTCPVQDWVKRCITGDVNRRAPLSKHRIFRLSEGAKGILAGFFCLDVLVEFMVFRASYLD